MDTVYNPQELEKRWYAHWEQSGYFKPSGKGPSYSIVIPPPNVTGRLHMGHGFQNCIMDALIRYHRMSGYNTLWQVGCDHAGIATQMVVERQLNADGKTRHDLGRGAFVEKIWEWKEKSGGFITGQLRRLGVSVDWSRERFTMDEGFTQAVQDVFIKLFDEGLIYRGKRLVNWDPKLLTAISDLEVINHDEQGYMWHIQYPLSDGSGSLTIATTRPETLLGDTAVAVHPDDARYQDLIGKTISLPLCDRDIPIIADDYVEQDFGSGCVKITPAHDFNDYAVGQRHNLPLLNVFTPDAKINENGPTAYQGMDRYEARKQIIADLETAGLIEKIEDHQLSIPRGDRSDVVIEPYLTDQWYVKATDLAGPALQVVKDGKITFTPENWTKTYYQWMENIEDWCISRQLWWGHRIPAWYDDSGKVYVADTEAAAREKYHLDASVVLKQDEDVLDTWFSSALWAFGTLGWPDNIESLKTYYPTSVLVTGFDIIFFWVARMVMMGEHFIQDIPFKDVFVTGLIRDSQGQKMSKSKGNILDPIDLIDGIDLESLVTKRTTGMMQPQLAKRIEKETRKDFPDGISTYGTDALRFTFCAISTPGRDIRFDVSRIETNRNFCNKIWNAARYILMNTENQDTGITEGDKTFSLADRWIQTRLQKTIDDVHLHFKAYRFDLLTQTLYDFTWNELCDWYLELSKPVLYDKDASPDALCGTRYTLVTVFETLLRLLHPLMPFITEEIWQKLAPLAGCEGETIMLQAFPPASPELADSSLVLDESSIRDIEWIKGFIIGVRNIRGEMNISPNKLLPILLHKGSEADKQLFETNQTFLQTLAKFESATWLSQNVELPPAASANVGELDILIPLAGLIDKDAELARLNKGLAKVEKEYEKINKMLSNDRFVANAPEAVVAKERANLAELELNGTKLKEQIDRISTL